jgi:hypothetical protein
MKMVISVQVMMRVILTMTRLTIVHLLLVSEEMEEGKGGYNYDCAPPFYSSFLFA